jgi:hypothetical protein
LNNKLLAHVYYYHDNHPAGSRFSCRGTIGAHMHFPSCSKADVALHMCNPTFEIGFYPRNRHEYIAEITAETYNNDIFEPLNKLAS